MIIELQDKVANYVTKNSNFTCWRDIREKYAFYSYITFMCLVAKMLDKDCRTDNVCNIIKEHGVEDENILRFVMAVKDAEIFIDEILELVKGDEAIDVNSLYQEYLSRDFILDGEEVAFEGGKNSRDVLGAYYTQENFAHEITRKAINDYFLHKQAKDENVRIADYSCGGGEFLVSACRICSEKKIPVNLYGYDVDPIAVLITRLRLCNELDSERGTICISLGNPLIRNKDESDPLSMFKLAAGGRFYSSGMGISAEGNMDIVIGNPPWEKIRFEEKKFLHHYTLDENIGTKSEREKYLQNLLENNKDYYDDFAFDYESAKLKIKRDVFFALSNCGELNTYALFTELCLNSLNDDGITGLIIKSSLVKMPVYSEFFRKITSDKSIYELYMFVNKRKIFNIDSREEFSVIYLKKRNHSNLQLAVNMDDFTDFCNRDKIELSYKLLNTLNPDTGMIPNIGSNKELDFLTFVYKNNSTFGKVYPLCKFGRLVHLTNHSAYIKRNVEDKYFPIYEGKFIELYTGKYATFNDMPENDKYKNKATAKPIENIDGDEYPQSRFFIKNDVWENLSKKFNGEFIIAWRSLTSATNRRTMLATILPLIPTCQSIQMLQLDNVEEMLHILSIFNSIIFDYIVRLKMAGLDLTQTIIKQIPVPNEEMFHKQIDFKGRKASLETHINSRIKKLYINDVRLDKLFDQIETYNVDDRKTRKELIAEIDNLVAFLYSIDKETLKKIAYTFDKYYSNEEVEKLF